MLTVEGLTKTYRTGDRALRSVGFTVPRGQVVGLIGPSGAGKSTLIRCINRLVEPTGGRVLLNDLDITALAGPALRRARRRIGMIFQEFALVERLTVMENVLSGRLGYVPFWRSLLRRFPPQDVADAFRLLDHYRRFLDSARLLLCEFEYTPEQLRDITLESVTVSPKQTLPTRPVRGHRRHALNETWS